MKGIILSSLIKLEKVNKLYQLGDQFFQALNNVNLELKQSELLAIVGMSGSGKSTLMNILGFLDQCTSGNYFFEGQDTSQLTNNELASIRNRKIGFVFQSFFLLARSTVLQNVMLPLFYRGTETALAKEKAMLLLEKMGVGHLANHRPNQLSGGQQQRVAIARALVGDPVVILADEPTGALDSQTGKDVMNLFKNLNGQEGRTIVMITHDQQISRQCQRTVTIKDGKID